MSRASASSTQGRAFGGLIDNLWFWAVLALVIMFIYASWVLIETISMHHIKVAMTLATPWGVDFYGSHT